jgi:hypothetical protein
MAIDDPAASDWCNLSWTQWQPLKAEVVRAFAPVSAGLYRARRACARRQRSAVERTMRRVKRTVNPRLRWFSPRCPYELVERLPNVPIRISTRFLTL